MSTPLIVGRPGVPEAVHHPHYQGHRTGPDGETIWTFADFDGTEPDPGILHHWPAEVVTARNALLGATLQEGHDGMPDFRWTNAMWDEARRLWRQARRRRVLNWASEHIAAPAQAYLTARDQVHTSWNDVEITPHTRLRGAILRLRAALADLEDIAKDLDQALDKAIRALRRDSRYGEDSITSQEVREILTSPGALDLWPPLEETAEVAHMQEPYLPARVQAERIVADYTHRLDNMMPPEQNNEETDR